MGYSNSKSVSTYVFGIPTNLYSFIMVISKWRREEKSACVRAWAARQRHRGWQAWINASSWCLLSTRGKHRSCSSWWCGSTLRLASSAWASSRTCLVPQVVRADKPAFHPPASFVSHYRRHRLLRLHRRLRNAGNFPFIVIKKKIRRRYSIISECFYRRIKKSNILDSKTKINKDRSSSTTFY